MIRRLIFGKKYEGISYYEYKFSDARIFYSTRESNILVSATNNGVFTTYTTLKNYDFTSNTITGDFLINGTLGVNNICQLKTPKGNNDVYSIWLQASGTNANNQIYINDIKSFLAQYPNLYSFGIESRDMNIQTFKGDLSQIPDSVERILLQSTRSLATSDYWLNLSNFSTSSKLKYFNRVFDGFNQNINVYGDLSKLPPLIQFFSLSQNLGNALTYTSGKVWANSFDTLNLGNATLSITDTDNLLIDMNNSITTAIGSKVINLSNCARSPISHIAYNNLVTKGFTITTNGIIKFEGDLSTIQSTINFFKLENNSSTDIITYTAGRVWVSSFDTLNLGNAKLSVTDTDNLLIDMANSITTAIGGKVIYLGGSYRYSASDAAVSYLTGLGFTISGVTRLSSAPMKILDLPFQNSFTDVSDQAMSIVVANANGLPSFVAGPKGTDYAVDFTGTKSLKTALNLAISNSDKVSISFWIKTGTSRGIIAEISTNFDANNAWSIEANKGGTNINVGSHTSSYNELRTVVTQGSWNHYVAIIDRASTLRLYRDKVLIGTFTSTHVGNFGAFPLFIGQRNGASFGLVGQVAYLKIFNYPLSQSEIDNLYNI